MDRRERNSDLEEVLRIAQDGHQSRIWTALPAILQSFDPERMVAEVQPTVSGVLRHPDGRFTELQLPLLADCPVVFPGGGGVTLTFPLKVGDEVLVVFASRCIDGWWQLGGVQGQVVLRMHDLSDGFVIPQVRSQPRRFTVSTAAAQLRTDEGDVLIELNPQSKAVRVETPGAVEVVAPAITLTGNVTVDGNLAVTGTMHNDGTNVGRTHVHSGVQSGPTNTGTPV